MKDKKLLKEERLDEVSGGSAKYGYAYHIDKDICVDCGECARDCPMQCIYQTWYGHEIDEGMCLCCGVCADVCPVGAVSE